MTELVRQRRRRRQVLTDAQVAALPRRTVAYFHPDPELPKFGIRIHPNRPGTYTVICRTPLGKQKWIKIGSTTEMIIDDARAVARDVIARVEKGKVAFEPPAPVADSVTVIAGQWLQRHVRKNGLRTANELERICNKYIVPHIGDRPFVEIRRSDIAALLDKIEDDHGAGMADEVLSTLRSIAVWWQKRDENYAMPFVRDMKRTPKQQRKRDRILNDDEIRAVWRHADDAGAFGAVVKLLLLTAQRLDKVMTMHHSDIKDDVWTVRTEDGEKGNIGKVRLPKAAMAIIKSQPRFVGNDFVFAGHRGRRAFNFSKLKREFDAGCGVTNWRLHDLRRTARSLMSRAKVVADHAEMVLGHSLGEIRSIYDVHEYLEEKSFVLRELATLLERIVNPPGATVTYMHEAVS